jgi:hypothetical protein
MKILLKIFLLFLASSFLVTPAGAEGESAVAAGVASERHAPQHYEVAENYAYKKRHYRKRGKRKHYRKRGRSFYYNKGYKRSYIKRSRPKHYHKKRHIHKRKRHSSVPFFYYDKHFYGTSKRRSHASYNAGSFCFGGKRYRNVGNAYTLRLKGSGYVSKIGFYAHDNIGRKHDAKLSVRTNSGYLARYIDVKKRGQYHEYHVRDRVRSLTFYAENDDEICIQDVRISSR